MASSNETERIASRPERGSLGSSNGTTVRTELAAVVGSAFTVASGAARFDAFCVVLADFFRGAFLAAVFLPATPCRAEEDLPLVIGSSELVVSVRNCTQPGSRREASYPASLVVRGETGAWRA